MLIKAFRGSCYLFSLVLMFVFTNPPPYPRVPVLQSQQWSLPETIPLYDPRTWTPVLVADQNRTVHAFSSQWIGDTSDASNRVIVYNRWSLEQGWTAPIDIIRSPSKEARLTDVYLDSEGVFHTLFFGGDNTGADIYYSKALAAIADDAWSWSAPIIVGENAGDPAGAVFFVDDQETIFVIYNGREFGNGLYVVNSGDGGETWSDPIQIFHTSSDEPNISDLQVVRSRSGRFHVIWNVNNIGGQGRGIFYAGSQDGNAWSQPVLLVDAQDGLGTQTPTIIEYSDRLFALYNILGKITMRRSSDDGQTWDDPSIIFPRHGGVNGSLSLVIDGNNDLHLFFGQRISGSGGPDIHGMWHSRLVNNRWIEPEGITKGPKIHDLVGDTSFDPSAARAVVLSGNVLLVTWMSDPGLKGNGVWYSYEKVNAPESPVHALPTPTQGAYLESDVDPQVTANSATPTVVHLPPSQREQTPWSANPILITGIAPIVALIFFLIVRKSKKDKK